MSGVCRMITSHMQLTCDLMCSVQLSCVNLEIKSSTYAIDEIIKSKTVILWLVDVFLGI